MTPTPPSAAATRADRVNGQLMQGSLGALLDKVPGARGVVPHLAALERALGALGASAIESIPPAGLTRICGQLASLPLPEGDRPLEELQARLMQALGGSGAAPAASAAKSAVKPGTVGAMLFVDSRLLSVDEASMTDFDAAMAAQDEQAALDPFA
ncbi:MAG: hypothetical protein M3Y32_05565 [Pseudomonadota bacterium]|nr:hypothetical protein [Pseudomonadota bacterium]